MTLDPKLKEMMAKAVEFHGHSCPGLAIGVVGSKIALDSAKRAEDEELVAVVENDACGVDAIQALTGCTYGKGNLIHKDFGKSVYTFYNRDTGKALRLSLKPEIFSADDDSGRRKEIFDKVISGTATDAEVAEHDELRQRHIDSILERGEEIFKITELATPAPAKARIFENLFCENCGEPFMATRVCERDGRKLCIPCCRELEMKQIKS
ncbi:FmdE family protein [[Eubacterium] cellulosolvens]